MSASVIGLWDLGWNTPLLEYDLWHYPLRDYAVDNFYMSPVSGIAKSGVQEVADIGPLLDELRTNGKTIVFVDEKGDTELADFVHPAEAVYVFGKASHSPLATHKQDQDQSVRIKTPNQLATLWPHQAAVLVLAHRNQ